MYFTQTTIFQLGKYSITYAWIMKVVLTVTMDAAYSDSTGFYEFGLWIYVDGIYLVGDYYYSETDETITTEFSLDGSCGPIYGCTDPVACNYNEEATNEDWTCTYPGCLDESASKLVILLRVVMMIHYVNTLNLVRAMK